MSNTATAVRLAILDERAKQDLKVAQHAEYLASLGFDRVTVKGAAQSRRYGLPVSYSIGCSQCEALVINRHPSHEQGCPNRVPLCRECGNPNPRGTCCTPEED